VNASTALGDAQTDVLFSLPLIEAIEPSESAAVPRMTRQEAL